MKKIYVAGKFEEKELILDTYKKLRELGYEISYDWTTHKSIKPYVENQETAKEYSKNEMKGISESDIFIFLSTKEGTTSKMEIGAAMLLKYIGKKPQTIYIVGEYNDKSPWFFNPIVKRVSNIQEVLDDLKNQNTN